MLLVNACVKLLFGFGVILVTLIIESYLWADYCPAFLCNPYENVDEIYDYIVVGAGSAGCVVSLRLAENARTSVLLLEAGPMGGSFLDIPAVLPILQLSSIDWAYKTLAQVNASKATKDNVSLWPRGKIVGGSGRLNNMIYTRGHPLDFAEWYKDKPDYNYERDILDYFKKSENHLGAYINDSKYHSKGGPLFVSDVPFLSELSDAFLGAAKALNFPERDLNGEFNTGFMKPQGNLNKGARFSTGHYLIKHLTNNLKLLTNAHVTKILFKSNYEAYAVKTYKLGVEKVIKARKGVVLCAGSLETAKLLLLSGLGPKEHLQEVGIELVADLAVGDNLQDHVATGIDLVTLNATLALTPFSLLKPQSIYDYIYKGEGPWTTLQCEAVGILYSACLNASNFDACASAQLKPPDLQFMAFPLGFNTDSGAFLRTIIGLKDAIWDTYLSELIGTPTIAILPIVLHPKSRGTVRLADNNPHSKLLINPNYLSHDYDVQTLIKGIQLLKKLIDTDSMQQFGAKLYDKPLPGECADGHVFDSLGYWECYVRHFTLTVYHPVGTARMGAKEHATSVVDYDFQVLKVNKLFVADASVMPTLPSANTNAATVMIAEKAAHAIKKLSYFNQHTSSIKKDIFYIY